MAVMIKNINKPNTCGDCTFNFAGMCAITNDEIEYEDEIFLDCPLEDLEESENKE
jgi:hypothetical protein